MVAIRWTIALGMEEGTGNANMLYNWVLFIEGLMQIILDFVFNCCRTLLFS